MIVPPTVHYNIYLEYSLREADVIKKSSLFLVFCMNLVSAQSQDQNVNITEILDRIGM